MEISRAMIPITTISSTNVKPLHFRREFIFTSLKSADRASAAARLVWVLI
jgi:hypothetical protein